MRQRWVAAAWAIWLGPFGAHKFYLGQTFQAVLMLLFFWTLIPVFVAFIETILLLVMTDEMFDKKFNN